MLRSKGLRVSIAGAVLVALSMLGLLFVPDAFPAITMMVGGVAVIGGFVWTLAGYYLGSPDPPPDA
jgi:hypothetical protein